MAAGVGNPRRERSPGSSRQPDPRAIRGAEFQTQGQRVGPGRSRGHQHVEHLPSKQSREKRQLADWMVKVDAAPAAAVAPQSDGEASEKRLYVTMRVPDDEATE